MTTNQSRKIKEALEELGNVTIQHFRDVMDSPMGINQKTGTNTLHDSDIYRELEFTTDAENGMVNILINSYFEYIDFGRMSHGEVSTGNFRPMKNNGFPPLMVLKEWAQKKGIPTDNRTLYLIGRSIAEKGIRPRPVFSYAWNDLDTLLMDYLTELFEAIMTDVTEWFNK